MLTITSITGECEPLTGFKGLKRNRKVNGEKTLSFTVLPTKDNQFSFPLVQEESIVEFDGDKYVIKLLSEKNIGNFYYKEVEAVHKFFNDMINDRIYETKTGSMTFGTAVNFIFDNSGYTTNIIDTFLAHEWENFGNNNRLALLQDLLEGYKAEFKVNDNTVSFYDKIGNDTDFQFRYGFNIKTIEQTIDTKGLSTYIKGTGKRDDDGNVLVSAEYTSPNAQIFGILHAEPVDDERYTTQDGLLQRLKDDLQDTPLVSITIDFVDLRNAGYPYIVPNEGDRVFIIYEPMDDLNIETRIMEIDEEFDENLDPVNTSVTLSNYNKNFAGTLFDTVDKAMSKIVDDNGKIKYNVLDDAVKQATEALKSAQTELEFNNGIIAREKTDPNKLVLFNSAGIGISSDGGNTFTTAMTGDGIVADVITAGQIDANNVTIYGGDQDNYTSIEGAHVEAKGTFTRTWRGVTQTSTIKLKLENGYFRARNDSLNRSLYFSDFGISTYMDGTGDYVEPGGGSSGSILWWDGTYSPTGANGITINSYGGVVALSSDTNRIVLDAEKSVNLESRQSNVFIRPYSEDRPGYNAFNFTLADDDDAARTDGYLMFGSDVNGYASGLRFSKSASNPTVYIVDGNYTRGGATTLDVGNVKTNDIRKRTTSTGVYWNGSGTGTTGGAGQDDTNTLIASGVKVRADDSDLFLATQNGGWVRVTDGYGYNSGNGITYRGIAASEFKPMSSERYKEDISVWGESALDRINLSVIYQYLHKNSENPDQKFKYGLVIERETPSEIVDGDGINLYSMQSFSWKAIQELSHRDDLLFEQNEQSILKIAMLESRIAKLEQKIGVA